MLYIKRESAIINSVWADRIFDSGALATKIWRALPITLPESYIFHILLFRFSFHFIPMDNLVSNSNSNSNEDQTVQSKWIKHVRLERIGLLDVLSMQAGNANQACAKLNLSDEPNGLSKSNKIENSNAPN